MALRPRATPRQAPVSREPGMDDRPKARLRSCGAQRFLEEGDGRPGRLELRGQEQDLRSTRSRWRDVQQVRDDRPGALPIPGVEARTGGRDRPPVAILGGTRRRQPGGMLRKVGRRQRLPALTSDPSGGFELRRDRSTRPGGTEGDVPTPRDLILDDRRQMSVRGTTALAACAVVHRCRQQGVREPDVVLGAHEEARVNGPVDDARVDIERPEEFGGSPAVGCDKEQRPHRGAVELAEACPQESCRPNPRQAGGPDRAMRHSIALVQARVRGTGCHRTRDGARGAWAWRTRRQVDPGAGSGWRPGSVGRPRDVRRQRSRPGSRVAPAARRACGVRAAT